MNNDSLLQAAQHSLTMAVLSATFATLIGSADRRGACIAIAFAANRSLAVCCCGDDVARYCDGHLPAGAVYADWRPAWFLVAAVSHITFCLPFVVVTVYSRLKGFDVRMLEAAKDLGASEMTILRKIILPLALPAVAAGGC